MTATESSKVKLIQLNLEINEDFTLAKNSERGASGAQTHNKYMLTPEAFKKCLMRAQRRANQEVDPVIYVDYYLLLEKVFKLYTDYERQYAKCLLDLKDEQIDSLTAKVDQLLTRTDHIIEQNDQQSIVLKQQSVALEQQSIEIQQLTYKIDTLFEYLLSFAHMTTSTP